MSRDPSTVDADLVSLVLGLSARADRPSDETEVRAALAPLSPSQEGVLRGAGAADPPARPLGPFGWADVARGVDPQVAAAREIGGYYALRAERDALAAMVGPSRRETLQAAEDPAPAQPGATPPPRRRSAKVPSDRAQHLLGLFAYHRDAPAVAKSLGVGLADLEEELDALKIRRKAFRLARGTDAETPRAAAIPGVPSGPPVRRRTAGRSAPAPLVSNAPRAEKEAQAGSLRALLAEVGPKRTELARRLGTRGEPLSDAALFARFRAAGLDRELSLRERDLVRALYKRFRGAEERVAEEIGCTRDQLRAILRERGLARELDALRQGYRREALNQPWPRERIEQVLHRRAWLEQIGVYDELEREVRTRARAAWDEAKDRPRAAEEWRKTLRISRGDAEKLQRLLGLR